MAAKNANYKWIVTGIVVVILFLVAGNIFANQDANTNKSESLIKKNNITPSDYNKDYSTRNLAGKMLVAMVIIVVLSIAAIWLSKKTIPKMQSIASREIQILESRPLGGRKTLHLLQVGSKTLLIATTVDRVVSLADVSHDIISEMEIPDAD